MYLCGDFNCRTGQLSDSAEQLGLERYIDLPCDDEQAFEIKNRSSFDSVVNVFGHKLISLCKEQNMKIVNGRLEPGRFTFIASSGVSVVDYFITQAKNFTKICDMQVFDISEFSDHCALDALEVNRGAFDNATECICNDASEADSQIIQMTNLIFDVCFFYMWQDSEGKPRTSCK